MGEQVNAPRHVPDEILPAPGVPRTLTGKKVEIPIKQLLQGRRAQEVVQLDALDDPAAMDWYATCARRWREKAGLA